MPKRYILVLIVIALIFFGSIFLLISLFSNGSGKKSNTQDTSQAPAHPKDLTKDADSVTYKTYGSVVGEEERRAISIKITTSERTAEVLQGYDEAVIKSQVTENKESAFQDFLIALQTAQFDQYDKNNKTDPRSQCATGIRYEYNVHYKDNTSISSWSTNCSRKDGSFLGNKTQVPVLFQAQVPDYSKFVSGVSL